MLVQIAETMPIRHVNGPVRYGVLGAGQMSRIALADLTSQPGAQVVGISDPSRERSREVGAQFGIEKICHDAAELLDPARLDAVYVATPNATHAPLARLALERGLHVLVEKPFGISHTEVSDLARLAREKNRVLSVALGQRLRPESQQVHRLVRSGALGDVYHVKAFWLRRRGIPKLGTWFGNKSLAGGGALLDIGVHLLDLALHLLGDFEPTQITGSVATQFGQHGRGEGGWGHSDRGELDFDVEDFATAFLRFRGGASLTLDVSWALHQAEEDRHDVVLYGSESSASCYPGSWIHDDGHGEFSHPLPDEPLPFPHASPFVNFTQHLLGHEELSVTLEQALLVQKILDAIYASARSGESISF